MPGNFSKKWKEFFKKGGFANLSFHCTRITCVTALPAPVKQRFFLPIIRSRPFHVGVVKSAGFVLVLVSLLLTGCNPYGDAVYVKVSGDDGSPISGASVTYRWSTGQPWGGPGSGTPHAVTVISDLTGLSHVQANLEHYLGIEVSSPGFYHCFVTVADADLGSHTDSETAFSVPLKRIIAPRPLIGKSAWVILPSLSGTIAYDLLAGDIVAPLGSGKVSDCEITWSPPPSHSRVNQRDLYDIRFTNPRAGITKGGTSASKVISGSDLRSDKVAPNSGYVSSMRKSEMARMHSGSTANSDAGDIYYFCIVREGGRLYGKILGEPQTIFFTGESHPVIKFAYAINPTGDLSLEPDLNSISFPQSNGYEKPYGLPEPN
jgi:hypothetical protein